MNRFTFIASKKTKSPHLFCDKCGVEVDPKTKSAIEQLPGVKVIKGRSFFGFKYCGECYENAKRAVKDYIGIKNR